jgi:phage tail sheath gpL-like
MAIQFNQIPQATLRVPLFYAELRGAQTPYVSPNRLLLLGQMTTSGTAIEGQPVYVQGDPRDYFGDNSMLADMVVAARANAPFQEIWALPMYDSAVGVAATGSIILPRALTAVAATGSNVTLAGGAPSTVDGHALAAGDSVLVWQQTNSTENGLYTVTALGTGANGTWSRHTDMNTATEFENALVVSVANGTAYGGSMFRLYRGATFTLGTTPATFTRTGLVSKATTISIWIGDVRVQSIAYTSDTGPTFAARLAAEINATTISAARPVTAVVNALDSRQIDLTARHKGTPGNSIYLDTNYYGDEGDTASVIFTFVQMSGGTGDPDFSTALANLGDEQFDWIVGPYTDSVLMGNIDVLLNDASGRWSPYQQIYGHYLGVKHDTISNLMTFGAGRNSPYTSVFGVYKAASPAWKWAGALGGRMSAHLAEPPELSRPLQSLDLIGILPPKQASDRPSIQERNSLYWSGISSYHVTGKTKVASIDRLVTNYRTNEWGSPDASWLDVVTRAQCMYSIRAFKAALTGQFPRAALMDDNPEGLEGVATPADIRAVIVHEYKRQEALAVVENSELFSSSLIVERSAQDANRVDIYLPADLVNQLRILAVSYVAHLQRAA